MSYSFEACCECGATWRVIVDEDIEDSMGTCIVCGADTYDLRPLGEVHGTFD
jgi:hypothetical protein